MTEIGSVSCCSRPEALVVIAAVPLCQVEVLDSLYARDLFEGGMFSDSAPEVFGNLAFSYDDMEFDQAAYELLPLRCAAVMDCCDAVALMQEVGHVVL